MYRLHMSSVATLMLAAACVQHASTILHATCQSQQDRHLIATLRMYINRRQKAGLSGVGVYPAQWVQCPLVLHIKYLLLIQGLDSV